MKHTDEPNNTDTVNRLYWDAKIDATNVLIEVNEGVMTLAGTVTNYKDGTNYKSRDLNDRYR